VTDHLTFGLRKESKLHAAQRRKTKIVPWDKSSHTLAHVVEVVVQQYIKEHGLPKNSSLLRAHTQERETTCKSSITWTNPQKSWMHSRIRFMLRYKSVTQSRCVHVILNVVVSRERCNALGRPVLSHGKHAWLTARVSGVCKLMKV
jgi:hypothetical protein